MSTPPVKVDRRFRASRAPTVGANIVLADITNLVIGGRLTVYEEHSMPAIVVLIGKGMYARHAVLTLEQAESLGRALLVNAQIRAAAGDVADKKRRDSRSAE